MEICIGFPQERDKLKFARRAGSQVVTSVVCNRSQPDPLGIVLWRDKLEFGGPSERVIPNQRAGFSGNLHRIMGNPSSYIPLFCTISIVC